MEKILGGPLSLGMALEGIRKGEEMSQGEFAKKIGISQQKLCDLEKGRRHVSPKRAAQFAKKLGHPVEVFVKLALQDQVNQDGLKLKVSVEAA
jgi:transcriptional regulator with XRE-family HTH domain